MILYLHGFRSSPRSIKARQLATRLDERGLGDAFRCPQLPVSPRAAAAAIDDLIHDDEAQPLAIIGSSLGGYYATWAAERVDCRLVLLNPATQPARDLVRHLGPQTVYHSDETVEIRPEFLDELKALRVGAVTRPERCLLVAAPATRSSTGARWSRVTRTCSSASSKAATTGSPTSATTSTP